MIYFILSLFSLVSGRLFGQDCHIVLNSGESYFELAYVVLNEDTLVVSNLEGELLRLPLERMQEISLLGRRNIMKEVRIYATATTLGGVVGYAAGLVFSQWALRFLSRDAEPKGWVSIRDASEEDRVIVRLLANISTALGVFHGFEWAREKVRTMGYYDLSEMTGNEKALLLSEIFE